MEYLIIFLITGLAIIVGLVILIRTLRNNAQQEKLIAGIEKKLKNN
ncbi:hypothetical protein [Gramella sp. AN32]|uniref:DUF4083 domain-containing protein n=1 Tax=Christiangramia antarctica TaxID=2058158 RepID=A0ABW5X3E3_9FLAO|nr:hypothetical protein [Gramella sp. AN32]